MLGHAQTAMKRARGMLAEAARSDECVLSCEARTAMICFMGDDAKRRQGSASFGFCREESPCSFVLCILCVGGTVCVGGGKGTFTSPCIKHSPLQVHKYTPVSLFAPLPAGLSTDPWTQAKSVQEAADNDFIVAQRINTGLPGPRHAAGTGSVSLRRSALLQADAAALTCCIPYDVRHGIRCT